MPIFALPKRKRVTVILAVVEGKSSLESGLLEVKKLLLKIYFKNNFAVWFQLPTFALPYGNESNERVTISS